jgi:acyl-CoA thioesterase-1
MIRRGSDEPVFPMPFWKIIVQVVQYVMFGSVWVFAGACDRSEPGSSSVPLNSPVQASKASEGRSIDRFTTERQREGDVQARDERPRIVAFGDSLTAGLGVSPDESYPAQLQRKLDAAGYRYRVINAGVSGDTTAGGIRRLDWILKSRPDIVIVELGANDGLRGLSIEYIRSNLEEIIKRLQAAGVTVLLTGMKLPPNYGAEYTQRFTALYEELSHRYRVAYMPFFLEDVGGKTVLNQPDGIHPTGGGYRIIVDNLLSVLEPLLSRPPNGRFEVSLGPYKTDSLYGQGTRKTDREAVRIF